MRAAGGREGPLQRAPLDRAPQERWERVQFTTHADATSRRQAIAQQAFAFADDGTLRACFAVCVAPSETSTPCEEAIASARFTFMAAPLPSPTATQQLARVLLAHPAAAGYGFLTTLGLCMLALLFARRTRFC